MARIAGIDIPREKRVEVSLTYIFGIGLPTSQKILAQANVNPDTRVRDLTEEQVNRLREIIDRRYKVEGDLRREVALNIKRLQEIGSYRGLRHRRNLPVRGPAHQDQCAPAARSQEDRRRPAQEVASSEGMSAGRPTGATSMAERKRATKTRRRRERKNVPVGHAHIQASFNNTIVTITDLGGAVISWGCAGVAGFKGSRKSTPYAAALSADGAARKAHGARHAPGRGLREGPGRRPRAAIRSLQAAGLEVTAITDVTPIPHNGCRPPKRRRV